MVAEDEDEPEAQDDEQQDLDDADTHLVGLGLLFWLLFTSFVAEIETISERPNSKFSTNKKTKMCFLPKY